MIGETRGRSVPMIVVPLKARNWWLSLCVSVGTGLAQPADLVLRNGRLVTLEQATPNAQAMAARGGKIIAIGTDQAVAKSIGPSTRVIDLHGRLAIPGFIEGHGHLTALGASKMMLDLRDAKNWDQIVAMVAAAAREAKPGTWILGSGFHQAKWDRTPEPNVRGFPVQESLSRVSPNNPVWLTHASGHAGFANAEALRQAGMGKDTPDPDGGEILRDSHGSPTGLLNERSQDYLLPRSRLAYPVLHRAQQPAYLVQSRPAQLIGGEHAAGGSFCGVPPVPIRSTKDGQGPVVQVCGQVCRKPL